MTYQLVYYSQQDPQWRSEILGFGDRTDTIGYVGCALTSVAMLLSGHGFTESPRSLNQKLRGANGFIGAGIRWGSVTQLYPLMTLKAYIPCTNSDAPLAQIDAALAAGQPAVVMIDGAPASGIQTHWVVLFAKKGDDYLMLDPWPYQTDVTKENPLMKRYGQGKSLQRTIMHVILYENSAASGGVELPSGAVVPPISVPSPAPRARVKDDVYWGLNIRTSSDTSSRTNVIETVPAGTELIIVEPGGEIKIGAINQWVRVHTPRGNEGVAAAWYMEKLEVPAPAPSTPPAPQPTPSPAPAPQPAPSTPPSPLPEPGERLKVFVPESVGAEGLKVYAYASARAKVVSVQPAGSVIACLEPYDIAYAKVGVKGEWLNIRYAVARFGYVQAELVERVKSA